MEIIKNGEQKAVTFGQETISGVHFIVRIQKNVNSTNWTPSVMKLDQVFVDIVLKRNGKIYDIVHGDLKTIAIESMLDTSAIGMAFGSGDCVYLQRPAAVGASAEVLLLPLRCDFRKILNLRKDDILEVKVNCQGGFINDAFKAICSDSGTYIKVDTIEAIGLETAIPKIVIKPLTDSDNRISWVLGNFVDSVTIINTDKTSYAIDGQICRNIVLRADKGVYIEDQYEDLITKQLHFYDNLDSAGKRSQNFRVFEGVGLNDVKLSGEFFNERIVAGKNSIVYRTYETAPEILELADTTEKIHAIENAQKLGMAAAVPESLGALEAKKEQLVNKR